MPVTKFPFPTDPELVAISIAYKNPRLVADEVLPRIPVGKKEFKYLEYPKGQMFTLPNTKVGRRGTPNQVNFDAQEKTSSTEDYGLDDVVPQDDIDNAPANYDPVQHATEGLRELILLDHEVRTATAVQDPNNYASSNKVQLSGTDQWNDGANSSPIDDIQGAIDACIMRPNKAVIGQAAWTKLRQHPDIVKAVHGNSGDKGLATREQVAELFELEEIIVGEGWVNNAKPGQDVNLVRVWGKHMVLFYQNRNANTQRGMTYGYTAQFGDPVAGQEPDSKVGLKGGTRVRNGESVKELITANDLGYLIEDCVA
ncbi:major capsid protein [Gracilimonas tropica]|uniref:major capsid protein n=1 Tax=Gracilimonas tropica TaxID=454600 RepID=UPI000376640D|nr:major capsid protein [Gracilimonas tropica]